MDGDADGYRAIGEWYDAEHDPVTDDVDLFLQLAEVVGDPILELGCGSGRVVAALAQAGHRVTGVDRSGPMLDRARVRLAGELCTSAVTLLHAEIDALPPSLMGRHGLVILSHNTLLHVTSTSRQRAVLAAARAALDPRGMIVVDLVNPLVDLRGSEAGCVVREGSWTVGGASVTKFSSASIDHAAQLVGTDIWYDVVDADGALTRSSTRLELRYVTAPELLLMLELSRFVDPLLYGSYDLDPYTETSPRLLITAEATRRG